MSISPEFVCHRCHCVDIIAVAYSSGELPTNGDPHLCTECQTGHWHCLFEKTKQQADDLIANQPTGLGLG